VHDLHQFTKLNSLILIFAGLLILIIPSMAFKNLNKLLTILKSFPLSLATTYGISVDFFV